MSVELPPVVEAPAAVDVRSGVAGGSGRLSLPSAFGATAAILVLFAAAASAPSPLYVVYQKEWGFSATTLTVIFAVYVFGLIGSLLTVGALSDHVGRRPVLGAAIALEAVALVLFLTAGDVTVLLVARVLRASPPARRSRRWAPHWSTSTRRTLQAAPASSTVSRPSADLRWERWAAVRSSSSRLLRRTWSSHCCWSEPVWRACSSPSCPRHRHGARAPLRR
jgi:hypothetical protein